MFKKIDERAESEDEKVDGLSISLSFGNDEVDRRVSISISFGVLVMLTCFVSMIFH